MTQINEYKTIIQKLNDEISNIIDNKDTEFESSSTSKQMDKKIKYLELEK